MTGKRGRRARAAAADAAGLAGTGVTALDLAATATAGGSGAPVTGSSVDGMTADASALSLLAADSAVVRRTKDGWRVGGDRKSTRLNSSHVEISYAVFCLK